MASATAATAGFLSTLPVRGATALTPPSKQKRGISIHAPREGSDEVVTVALTPKQISIHAPREGSDVVLPMPTDSHQQRFLSTLPVRGATQSGRPGPRPDLDF